MSPSTLPDAPTSPHVAPETLLGEKYKVTRLLGEGGMGAVYEAENTWTRRRVALKLMRPEYARNAESVERFLCEAQSAAQIDHPNVVSVLDLGRDAATGSLFIVQEFLVGRELREVLDARGALPPEEAMELLLPVVDGLVAAHARGVVHRDLKPENIFLVESRTGRLAPKLIDFGIAKELRPRESGFRTLTGRTIGTPGYMSPEQVRGDVDIDARADVWAMGVVLYEALAGRLPFDHDENVQVMLARVLTSAPEPLERFAPAASPELCAVIDRAVRSDREQRFPDMLSFHDALAATGVGQRARDTLRKQRAETLAGPPATAPRAWWVAAAIAAVALLAVLVVGRSRRTAPMPAPSARVTAPPSPVTPPVAPPAPLAPPAPVLPPTAVAAPAVPPPAVPDRRDVRRPRRRGGAERGANGAAIIE
jgi:serine/threonine-protein kinase